MPSGHLYQLNKNNALNRKFQRKTKQQHAISNFFFQNFFSFQNQGFAPHISAFPLPPSPCIIPRKKLPPIKNKRTFRLIQMNVWKTKKRTFARNEKQRKRKTKGKAKQATQGKEKRNALYYFILYIIYYILFILLYYIPFILFFHVITIL